MGGLPPMVNNPKQVAARGNTIRYRVFEVCHEGGGLPPMVNNPKQVAARGNTIRYRVFEVCHGGAATHGQ